MTYRVVIPARYASVRLPGKPLREIAGKPMLQHVYARASESQAAEVIIATDDARIQQAANDFGAKVCMTSATHTSGTERLAEVASQCGFTDEDIIVNLQGDEPLMPASCLDQVAEALNAENSAQMATLCAPIHSTEELFDYHIVKVVRDKQDFALYFSRAPIPWHREEYARDIPRLPEDGTPYYRHIGLYAYRAGFIKEYIAADVSPLEQAESLEQLRVLWHGGKIIVPVAKEIPGPGVDTEADFQKVAALLGGD